MREVVLARKIPYLLHFTKLENLHSILTNGIVPRQALEEAGRQFLASDAYRHDGFPSASSFSLGHPNYKMFYSLRMQDPQQRWVVLACRPDVLWEKDCAFCVQNAANAQVAAIPIEERKGHLAFSAMFEPFADRPSRQELGIPDSCPTNPQAEVLVFDQVEPRLIYGAASEDRQLAEQLRIAFPHFQMLHMPSLFRARKDFQHWRQA